MNEENSGHNSSNDCSVGTTAELTTDAFMVKIKRCEKAMIGLQYYRMDSNPRGFCLIFNIFEFANTHYDLRKGSQNEAKTLSEVFSELHFIPKVFDNPSAKDIEITVEEFSQKSELEEHNAFVLIVLSHGKSDGFIGSDGKCIAFREIVDKFNNKNCKQLIDKPKLFFFSCCRGDSKDFGVSHTFSALNDIHMNAVSDTIMGSTPIDSTRTITKLFPMSSDIIICYSTVDGYVSWRCEQNGTWLGTVLRDTLLKHSHNMDLLSMLTKIIDERTASPLYDYPAKQAIEIILRGFKRSFYFNPGYYEKSIDNLTETDG